MLTFQQWLWRQRHRDDPVGDLAKDAAKDCAKPSGPSTFAPWRRHLIRMDACVGAHRALGRAWQEYREEVEPCRSTRG